VLRFHIDQQRDGDGQRRGNSSDLFVSADANTGQFNCSDEFEHAPSVLSKSNTFTGATGTIVSTDTFPASSGIVLNPGSTVGNPNAFWVCFQANQTFKDVVTGNDVLEASNGRTPASFPCAIRFRRMAMSDHA